MKNKKAKFIRNNLRMCRKGRGLTQKEVADRMKLKSTAGISRWESGRCFPETENLIGLAAVYRVSVEKMYWNYIQEMRHEMSAEEELLFAKKNV